LALPFVKPPLDQVRVSQPGSQPPQQTVSATSCSELPSTHGRRNQRRSATRSSMRLLGYSAYLDALGIVPPDGFGS
jgi:hypothetical protein